MKLIVHTPELGDWTVVEDERGNIIYSGHDSFNELGRAIVARFYDDSDIKYLIYSDEEFEGLF
jgi:hypothetical protein